MAKINRIICDTCGCEIHKGIAFHGKIIVTKPGESASYSIDLDNDYCVNCVSRISALAWKFMNRCVAGRVEFDFIMRIKLADYKCGNP